MKFGFRELESGGLYWKGAQKGWVPSGFLGDFIRLLGKVGKPEH